MLGTNFFNKKKYVSIYYRIEVNFKDKERRKFGSFVYMCRPKFAYIPLFTILGSVDLNEIPKDTNDFQTLMLQTTSIGPIKIKCKESRTE